MSKAMPWFPFYPTDWVGSFKVLRMSLAQRGAYIGLLAFQAEEGVIPDDPEEMRAILGCTEKQFEEVWMRPLTDCFEKTEKGWVNFRLQEVIEEAEKKYRKRVAAGRKAAKSRWDKKKQSSKTNSKGNANAYATALRTQSDGNANHNHSHIKSEDTRARDPDSQLRTWLGDHAGALDGFPDNPPVESSLFGLYSPDVGTESFIWAETKPEDRPRLFATALLRASGETREWRGHFFKSILLKVIAESKAGRGDPDDDGDRYDALVQKTLAERDEIAKQRAAAREALGPAGPRLREMVKNIGTIPKERPAA